MTQDKCVKVAWSDHLDKAHGATGKIRKRQGDIECDEALFEQLRLLRKRLADDRNIPSYIVFSDVALRQMARSYPTTVEEFGRISGVGEMKLREFGEIFTKEICSFLTSHPGTDRHFFAAS